MDLSWVVPIVVAVIMSAPGVLAWRRQKHQDAGAAHAAAKQARKDYETSAVEGFARLVAELRTERAQDKKDCERRLQEVKRDLLVKIVELEDRLLQYEPETP